jgi:hypothetical protein
MICISIGIPSNHPPPLKKTHTHIIADIKHLRRALLEMQLTITISLESCNGPKGLPSVLDIFPYVANILCTGTHGFHNACLLVAAIH